ncbi:unnamed protein product [Brachionus calyciflorus]|uniref:Uncharacterized protein n=1 Tax=Brachionus calyciflorus TaxID=104777 RepID=A0A813M2B4_9BILA|nr:unnamed protein product [Brachionus calyciflorus]
MIVLILHSLLPLMIEHSIDDFLRQFNVNENADNENAQQELYNTGSFQIPLEIQILENTEESSNYVQSSTSTYNLRILIEIQIQGISDESSSELENDSFNYIESLTNMDGLNQMREERRQ